MSALDWFRECTGLDWPRVLLAALLVVTLVAVGVASATSAAPFSPYGTTWEATSEFRTHVDGDPNRDLVILTDAADYADLEPTETTAFVVAPTTAYEEDADRLVAFLEAGGTLVVLDSVGPYANPLIADLGADARLDGRILQDDRHYDRGPLMPHATEVADDLRTAGVDQLTLNYATAIEPGAATVLVATSPYAYLGAPVDEIDDDTELSSYPVATAESIGAGELVVVGDPSIAIDAMIDAPDNRAFLDGITGDRTTVAIDASHGPSLPPARVAISWLSANPLAQAVIGIGLIAALAVAGERRLVVRRRKDPPSVQLSPEARRAYLARRHPDWDENRLDRVVSTLNHPGEEAERDRR